jgi:hypothetical protein
MRGSATRLLLACLVALTAPTTLTPATSPATLDWPFGQTSQLTSPDGRHIIYGEPYRRGVRDGPELWLRHSGRPDRVRLLELGSTSHTFWFPDSLNFVVVDREGSDSMTSSIYDSDGHVVLDLRAALTRFDKELGAVATGHFYVEAQRLLDANTLRVAAFGHTDDPPVRCFRFTYNFTRTGIVQRLTKRISPVSPVTFCNETSE